jgi:hypothetical protein
MEDQFETVKQYLQRNPHMNIQQISEGTGVPEKTIANYLKEGRIVAGNVSKGVGLKCELCGAAISVGRFCEACSRKLTEGLKHSALELNIPKHTAAPAEGKSKPEWSRSRYRDNR